MPGLTVVMHYLLYKYSGYNAVSVLLLCCVVALWLGCSKIWTGISDFFLPVVFKWFCCPKFCMELNHDRSIAYALQGYIHSHVYRNSYNTSSNIFIKIAWSRWKLKWCSRVIVPTRWTIYFQFISITSWWWAKKIAQNV
jgi:hypothetical protein